MSERWEPSMADEPQGVLTTDIDTPFLARLRSFLEKHGAAMNVLSTQSYQARPNRREETRESNTCEITFPIGTVRRRQGLRTSYVEPFVILFPDGAELKAQDRHPLNASQQFRTVLGVPDSE